MGTVSAGIVSIDAQADDFKEIPVNIATATATSVLVVGVAGQVIKLYRLDITVAAATNLTIKDGTTSIRGPYYMLANGSIVLDFSGRPWVTTTIGNDLILSSSTSASIGGGASYKQNAPSPV